jgi:ribose 5-phosphate isomerase RpiB
VAAQDVSPLRTAERIPGAGDHAGFEPAGAVAVRLAERRSAVQDVGSASPESLVLLSPGDAMTVLETRLDTPFNGGRHGRRTVTID